MSAIGGLLGGIIGQNASAGNAATAANQAAQANQIMQNLQPAANMAAPINLQQFQQAGTINPQLAAAISAGPSAMQGITTNGQGIQAQQQALQALQQRAAGGMNAQDRAALAQAQLQAGQAAQSKQAQVMQQFQQMGQGGSGASLAAQLAAAQNGTNQLSQSANQIMGQSQQQALQAASQAGGMGAQLESQQFGEAAQKAQAADQMQRFNVQNQLATQQANVGAQNQAQYANLANLQNVGNQNVSQANQAAYAQRAGEQQNFANSVGLAGAQAGAAQQYGNFANQQAQQQAQAGANLGAGIGNAVGGIANFAFHDGGAVSDYRNGGHVPGQAKVPGDSPLNDTVDAKLSPGEIVIPRTLAKSELGDKLLSLLDAHHEIKSHLDKADKKGQKRPANERNPMGTYHNGGAAGRQSQGNGGMPFYSGGMANTGSSSSFEPVIPQDDMYMQNLLNEFYQRMSGQAANEMIGNKPVPAYAQGGRVNYQGYNSGGQATGAAAPGYAEPGSDDDIGNNYKKSHPDAGPYEVKDAIQQYRQHQSDLQKIQQNPNQFQPQGAVPSQSNNLGQNIAGNLQRIQQGGNQPGMYDGGSVQPGYADGGSISDYDPDNHDDVFDKQQQGSDEKAAGESMFAPGEVDRVANMDMSKYNDAAANSLSPNSMPTDASMSSQSNNPSVLQKLLGAFNPQSDSDKSDAKAPASSNITIPQMPSSNPQMQQALAGIAASKMAIPQMQAPQANFQMPGMADGGQVPNGAVPPKGSRQYLEYLMGQLKNPTKIPKKMSNGGKVKGYADPDGPVTADDDQPATPSADDEIESAEEAQEPSVPEQSPDTNASTGPSKADLEEAALEDAKAKEDDLRKDQAESQTEADTKKEVEGRDDEDLQASTDKDLKDEENREPASDDEEFEDADVKTEGLPKDVDTSASALRDAQRKRAFNEFMANGADAAALLAAGIAGHGATPASPAYNQGLRNSAGLPVKEYAEQVANQSEDPNSTMSGVVRDYMTSKGLQVPDEASASDLFKIAPFLQRDSLLQGQIQKAIMQQQQANRRNAATNEARIQAARIAAQSREQSGENKQAQTQGNNEIKMEKDAQMMRGKPALARANQDLLSADKALAIVKPYKDLNDLPPNQVALLNAEIAKIAGGGVPTDLMMKDLNNTTYVGDYQKLLQKITNRPRGMDQGSFLKLQLGYLKDLKDVSHKLVSDNLGASIKSYENSVSPEAYHRAVATHSDLLGLYTPQQEAGISKVMTGLGISRSKAILKLIDAGKLPKESLDY